MDSWVDDCLRRAVEVPEPFCCCPDSLDFEPLLSCGDVAATLSLASKTSDWETQYTQKMIQAAIGRSETMIEMTPRLLMS